MEKKLLNIFKKINANNKFGHAYLIYNTDFSIVEEDLNKIIINYLMNTDVDIKNNPDVHIIAPTGQKITKDQILSLEKSLASKSQINENIVYIINEADKLNDYAANSLLKTLEEPEKNIYAFLITDNLEKIWDTIKSRCILIKINDKILPIEETYEEKLIEIAIDIINKLEKNLNVEESKIYKIFKNKDRIETKQIFELINLYYKDCVNKINNRKIEFFINYEKEIISILDINNSSTLIKKILLINEEIKNLDYNVNINLFLDNFILKFERCNNG